MKKYFSLFLILFLTNVCLAQSKKTGWASDNFFKTDCIIENKGQFEQLQNHVKDIQYAIQNKGDEFYFTKTGYTVKLGKQIFKKGYELESERKKEREREKRDGKTEAERELEEWNSAKMQTDWLEMQWLNTNENVQIITSNKTKHYFTYGTENYNSYGYEKITYKNLYDGIDVIYEVHPKGGMEYTLHLQPGADLSKVKYKYIGADAKVLEKSFGLQINNSIKPLVEANLKAFYKGSTAPLEIKYFVKNNEISFVAGETLDITKELIIDPWVTTLTTLTGIAACANIGYDVDNDAFGNLFVFGGGGDLGTAATAFPKVAKYDPAGVLLWTFSGQLVAPAWNSSPGSPGNGYERAGNFVVNKTNSKVYVSQGLNLLGTGSVVIRLNGLGVYDNYITTSNNQFEEVWEMKLSCFTDEVMAIGGGTSSNINFGILDTTTGVVGNVNITGLPGAGQDALNATIGPNGTVYLISVNTGTNDMYKLNATNNGFVWNTSSGGAPFTEQGNKSYTGIGAFSNGYNALAVNPTHLFYYDGLSLKCFSEATGLAIGTALSVPGGSTINQGGIYANSCDEVFIGGPSGNVFKYFFNGTNFVLQNTLTIAGQAGNKVHDIVFNGSNNLLYVCGDNFVAAVDPLSTCVGTTGPAVQLSSQVVCPNTIIVNVTNAVATNGYTFIWQDSVTGATVQNTIQPIGLSADTLLNASPLVTYKVTVIQRAACQVLSNFIYVHTGCDDTSIYLCPGETFTLSNGTIISTPGSYTDTFTNTLGLDSIISLTIYDGLDTVIINDTICPNEQYTLPNGTITSNIGTYNFNYTNIHNCDSTIIVNLFGKNTTFSSTNVSICSNSTYTLPDGVVTNIAGTYLDTLTNAVGCDSVITTNLTVITSVPYTVSNDTIYCKPSSAIPLFATGGTSVAWTSSTGPVCATCYTQTVSPTGNVNYYAVITDGTGCVSRDTVRVRIVPFVMFFNASNQSICEGQPVSFSSQVIGAGASGTIHFGNGTTIPQTPLSQFTYTAPGVYTAYLLGKDTLGCKDSIAKVVTVTGKNRLSFTVADSTLCLGQPLIIKDTISPAVVNFEYDFKDLTILKDVNNPTHTYQTSGTYLVQLRGQNPRCPDSVMVKKVVVYDYPLVNLGADTAICPLVSSPINLVNKTGSGAQSYLWSTGDVGTSIQATEPKTYWLQASNNDCSAADTIVVARDCYLNIPNAFTPNSGDNLNNTFMPQDLLSKGVTAYSMNIFNRWGNEVFNTTNINSRGWDGKYGDKDQPMGVYIYNIKVTFRNGESKTYTGNVTLLR